MGSRASCCHEDVPETPKELVEANHACEDEPEQGLAEGPTTLADVETAETLEVKDVVPAPEAVRSQRSHLEEINQLEVDSEILRGIGLRASLQRGGRLWRCSPLDLDEGERGQLWSRSRTVQHFDVFLSHTWHTPGKWKMLSLLMQAGWKWVIFLQAVMAVCVACLCVSGILPLPLSYAAQCPDFKKEVPYAPWTLLCAFISTVVGLLASPYLPEGFARPLVWDAVCFLDAVSINQTDPALMERGIYGLGGFLRVSRELRVLWSRPYLSRLWCVFELAAYRTANPSGQITLAPLYIERAMVLLFISTYFACVLFVLAVTLGLFRQLFVPAVAAVYFVGLSPFLFAMHGLRRNMAEKHHLLVELKNFDLDKAQTRSDFDRAFVHSAIVKWYGSKEAFVQYVRGPLCEELMTAESTSLPLAYSLMTSMVTFTGAVDDFIALWKGGAGAECLLSTLFGFGLGLQIFWFVATLRLSFYLVERFAEPWWTGWLDYLQTFVLYLFTYLWFMLGGIIAQTTCRADLWMAAVWLLVSGCVTMAVLGGGHWLARACQPKGFGAEK